MKREVALAAKYYEQKTEKIKISSIGLTKRTPFQ